MLSLSREDELEAHRMIMEAYGEAADSGLQTFGAMWNLAKMLKEQPEETCDAFRQSIVEAEQALSESDAYDYGMNIFLLLGLVAPVGKGNKRGLQ